MLQLTFLLIWITLSAERLSKLERVMEDGSGSLDCHRTLPGSVDWLAVQEEKVVRELAQGA